MEAIKKEIEKTRFKVLFNSLLIEAENFAEVKTLYKKGILYKVRVTENTILNKYLIRI